MKVYVIRALEIKIFDFLKKIMFQFRMLKECSMYSLTRLFKITHIYIINMSRLVQFDVDEIWVTYNPT